MGNKNNRLLSKLAPARKVEGGAERKTGVYTSVHEDLSTEPTHKFPAGVEFRKKSNEWDALLNHTPHSLNVDGTHILVEDRVFTPNPTLTYSTFILLENFPPLKNKLIADVGTGTGVLAVKAAQKGAKAIATDISDAAIANASVNIKKNRVGRNIRLIKTSLLDGIDEKFDYIFANLPILDECWTNENINIHSVLANFFKTAKEKLKTGGKIYFPWASFAEEKRASLEKYFLTLGYSFNLKTKKALEYTWYLYILSKTDIRNGTSL